MTSVRRTVRTNTNSSLKHKIADRVRDTDTMLTLVMKKQIICSIYSLFFNVKYALAYNARLYAKTLKFSGEGRLYQLPPLGRGNPPPGPHPPRRDLRASGTHCSAPSGCIPDPRLLHSRSKLGGALSQFLPLRLWGQTPLTSSIKIKIKVI